MMNNIATALTSLVMIAVFSYTFEGFKKHITNKETPNDKKIIYLILCGFCIFGLLLSVYYFGTSVSEYYETRRA